MYTNERDRESHYGTSATTEWCENDVMFSKIKKPISLNSVTHVINKNKDDLSPQLSSKDLNIAMVLQYGLPQNSIAAIAFDPVQSLLAISTINHEIRVFGQNTVEVVFEFNSSTPIVFLKFIKGVYLVAILANSSITILSLHSKKILATLSPHGSVSCVALDPALDWLILGLNNGSLLFLDVDRLNMAPLRIDNLQKRILPKEKLSPVLSIEWHPRDVGTILITYSHCSILYSLATGEIKNSFVYVIPKLARSFEWALSVSNNGKRKIFSSPKEVISEMVESHFHPNGLHVVTVHKDNSLVFWDCASGTILEARGIFDLNLHKPGPSLTQNEDNYFPIQSVSWICGKDPEETKLIIVGGFADKLNMIYILDFGLTLKYSLTSHDKQGEFYSHPTNGQKNLVIPFYVNKTSETEYLLDIYPLAHDGLPYFNAGHNPGYLLLKSNINNIYISPLNDVLIDLGKVLLPPSIAFVHPPVTFCNVESIRRIDWYGVQSSRISSGVQAKTELLLKGGAAVNENRLRTIGSNEAYRKVLITGHETGIVRLLDITRGEVGEQEGLIQISVKETLVCNNASDLYISHVSCAFEDQHLIIGLGNGNVVLCKFGRLNLGKTPNPPTYDDCPIQHRNGDVKLIDIRTRIRGSFASSSTFLPTHLLQLPEANDITGLKVCDVGFMAIAYKTGKVVVCDVGRGPAIIYNIDSISSLVPTASPGCYITSLEFAILEYGQEGFSSILLIAGTNEGGNVLYFKIIPQANGGFQVVFADKAIKLIHRPNQGSCIRRIIPVSIKGQLATPSQEVFHKLSQGILIPGYIIVCSDKDTRVLKSPKQKISHQVIDDYCNDSGIVNVGREGIILATVLTSGVVKFSSLPSLNGTTDYKLTKDSLKGFQASDLSEVKVFLTGEIFVKFGDSEFINLAIVVDTNTKQGDTVDLLFNESSIIPPRPTVGALQWAKGSTAITVDELNQLIGGPNRKPPKHPECQLAYNISPEANLQRYNYGHAEFGKEEKAYKEPVRKATGARSNFGTAGFMRSMRDGIDSIGESVNGYASSMSEAMNEGLESQKKEMYSSAFKSKFGF